VYDIVLTMQQRCISAIKAGVRWEDIHVLAHRLAIEGFLRLGILRGDAQEIFDARTMVAFLPHGLGHYLGMDTHDTGGNPNYNDPDPMFRFLRVRGTVPAGSVVTVEPGVSFFLCIIIIVVFMCSFFSDKQQLYFCRFIIEPYLADEKQARFIDAAVLDKYWDVGGVRYVT